MNHPGVELARGALKGQSGDLKRHVPHVDPRSRTPSAFEAHAGGCARLGARRIHQLPRLAVPGNHGWGVLRF